MPEPQAVFRLPKVLEITGLSRSTIYSEISKGRFPAPVRLTGRTVGWQEDDLIAWLNDREKTKRAIFFGE